VLIHPDIGNLVLLPGGDPVPNSSELLRSPMMRDLVGELRDRYPNRMIFFDVPPILSGADTLALSSYLDAMILLVAESETSRNDITRSCELLREANLLGIVLNKSRELRKPDPATRRRPRGFLRRLLGNGD
jgi:Mrp family chromosome partitioning ATPase